MLGNDAGRVFLEFGIMLDNLHSLTCGENIKIKWFR